MDRSSNLLGTGNDISLTNVFNELNAYNSYLNHDTLVINGINDDRYIDIGESNAFIITNAYDGYVSCLVERSRTNVDYEPNVDAEFDLPDETPEEDDSLNEVTRKDFPETWIFDKIQVNTNGIEYLERNFPDTITSWDISGFSISSTSGLGLSKPLNLVVAPKFFVMINLPYSVRVGEILRVEVSVFSFDEKQSKPLEVDVTLYNVVDTSREIINETGSDEEDYVYEYDEQEEKAEFEFYESAKVDGTCQYKKSVITNDEKRQTNRVKVAKNSGHHTHFFIKATRPGNRRIKIRAIDTKSNSRVDVVERILKVDYEGLTVYNNKARLIDLRKQRKDSYDFEISISDDAFKKSIKLGAAVFGDLIGPTLYNTQNLM